jgi:hypothetical protein
VPRRPYAQFLELLFQDEIHVRHHAMNFNFRRFEYANSIALQEGEQSSKIPLLHKELSDLADGLQKGMSILLPEVTELLEKISEYLATNDKKSGRTLSQSPR